MFRSFIERFIACRVHYFVRDVPVIQKLNGPLVDDLMSAGWDDITVHLNQNTDYFFEQLEKSRGGDEKMISRPMKRKCENVDPDFNIAQNTSSPHNVKHHGDQEYEKAIKIEKTPLYEIKNLCSQYMDSQCSPASAAKSVTNEWGTKHLSKKVKSESNILPSTPETRVPGLSYLSRRNKPTLL